MNPKRWFRAAATLTFALAAQAAWAQSFPTQSVRIIVPFPAGGGIDVFVRALAVELTDRWKQPVLVENRGGAGSLIGAGAVAQATPDGHTLMATVNQTITANPFLYRKLPYDPVKSFVPVTQMTQSDMFVLANPKVPARDLRELVSLIRREPKKHNFGSFGIGSQPHLMFETFNQREKLDLLHVPYNGIAPLLTGIIAGDVELTTGSAQVAGELIKAGKLKALAVAGSRRFAAFPDVATTAEQGLPYLRSAIWFALFAPAGTRPEVANKISADVRAILALPAWAEKHAGAKGLTIVGSTPEALASTITEETAAMAEMVKAAGIHPE